MKKYDFSGWATKYNIRCSDGRTILSHAFDDVDGKRVPLVWQHKHDSILNVLGHADLEARPEGVVAHCVLNDSEMANHAKKVLANEDLAQLSIYANNLKQSAGNVMHGVIREVSLVLSGANDGALINYPIIEHSDGSFEDNLSEAEIWSGELIHWSEDEDELFHAKDDEEEEDEEVEEDTESTESDETEDKEEVEESEEDKNESEEDDEEDKEKKLAHADESDDDDDADKGKTVGDVLRSLNDEQAKAMAYTNTQFYVKGVADGMEKVKNKDKDDDDEGEEEMKHNAFDTELQNEDVLSHDAMADILSVESLKRNGTAKESVLAHAAEYGIDGIEWLFPEDHELNRTPEFIQRDQSWVTVVMNGVHHLPFSRVKSTFADIREDEARAKGYFKGRLKKEEVFPLLRRRTEPTTIYKKQKLDRDDIIDITDFDVVAWIKAEMRVMLNEEIARAILIGDGRSAADEDKIDETKIRPIANDADLYTIKRAVVAVQDEDFYKTFIKTAIRARKDYKGSGNPTLFTTEEVLTEMLLLENSIGEPLYKTEAELATKLRVSRIVTVEVMEGAQIGGKDLLGIIVNLADYSVGADKGGSINMFEDFDIDYNQEKYLIETRCSGALVKPYSAICLFRSEVPTSVDGGITYSKTVTSVANS